MTDLRWSLVLTAACLGLLAPVAPASAATPARSLVTTHVSFAGFDSSMPAGATVSVIQRCPVGTVLDKAATRERYPELDLQLQGEPNVRLASRELWVAGLVSRYRVVRSGGVPTEDGFGLINAAVCSGRAAPGSTALTGRASTDVRVWNRAPAGVRLYVLTSVEVQDSARSAELPYLSTVAGAGVAPSSGALSSGVRAVQAAETEAGPAFLRVDGTTLRPVTPGRFASMNSSYSFTADLTRRVPDPEAPETLPITVEGQIGEGGRCTVEPEQVAAGEHEVTFIAVDGPSSIVLRDGNGASVFAREAQQQEVPPGEGAEEGAAYGVSQPAVVRLAEGTYTVECRPAAGAVSTTRLRVVPARASQP